MAKTPQINQSEVLAEVVLAWADEHRALDDPYIQGLTQGLLQNKNLAMWASLDPFALIPEPVNEKHSYLTKIYRRLNILRNALVFAPVALTWLAVGKATSAFAVFVEQNSTAPVNFLEFWQNGYDVLDSKWRISNVALADFAIVLAVIALTIFSNYIGEAASRLEADHDEVLRRERIELGIAIKEHLHAKQSPTRLTLNQGVATSIENLVIATENLKKPRRRTAAKKN